MIETLVRPETPTRAPVRRERRTRIKPTEALRLGRLQYPVRVTGGLYDESRQGACALGAIYAGMGVEAGGPGLRGFMLRARAIYRTRRRGLGILDQMRLAGMFDEMESRHQKHSYYEDGDTVALRWLENKGL